MSTPAPRRCKDCVVDGVTTNRPLADGVPGPRCTTHARAWRKRSQRLAHERRLESDFQISAEVYWALYEAQGGKCFVCAVATGKSKRLAVEHDHRKCADEAATIGLPPPHPPEKGCPNCINALTCSRCNRLVAFLNVEQLARAIQLLVDPPARKILNQLRERGILK